MAPVTRERKESPSRREPRARDGDSYHHGNLRDALIDVAIEMIDESGLAAFSMAAACRRLDVTAAAPYRHFADRNAVLVAVALRACDAMAKALNTATAGQDDPVEQLTDAVQAYVRFAAEERALFDTLFSDEVSLAENAELGAAALPIVEAMVVPALKLPKTSPELAVRVVIGVIGTAQGCAAFLRAGTFLGGEDPVRAAAEHAALSARAMIAGRKEIQSGVSHREVKLAGMTAEAWVKSVRKASEVPTP